MAIKWTEDHSNFKAYVGLFCIVVSYKMPRDKESGYYVTVSGAIARRIEKPYSNVEDAKLAGIDLAKRQARRILAEIEAEMTP